MTRSLTIDPVTRIEGHARVELEIGDDGKVARTLFKVMDFRGFEAFLKGMQVEMMPTILARICGTCPQSQHLASAKAVDKIFGAVPPRPAVLLRTALNLGGLIHSHAVHFFALAAPDILLPAGTPPADRNIMGLLKATPDVARKGLQLRSVGQRVAEVIGGRGTHPVAAVVGGLAGPLTPERHATLKRLADEALPLTIELVETARKALLARTDLVEQLPLETAYLGTVKEGALDLYDGTLRLRSPDGTQVEFEEDDWMSRIHEEVLPASYGKITFCKDSSGTPIPYRVGALARLNCVDRIDTPLANAELQRFRELGGSPCHQTVLYHYARMVEMLYAAEKLAQIASDPEILSPNVRTAPTHAPRSAGAHVEAPRGVLIHHFDVDDKGIVQRANLLVATQQNLSSMNQTIGLSASKLLDAPDEALMTAVEFGIRCYDPCLSCATHRLGEMKLEVVVRRGGEILREARR